MQAASSKERLVNELLAYFLGSMMLSTGEGSYVDVDLKDFTLWEEKTIQR